MSFLSYRVRPSSIKGVDEPEPIEHALILHQLSHNSRSDGLPPCRCHSPPSLDEEVAAASTLLARPGVRLLTLSGTGGVGKTRLALAIASEVERTLADGVCFVSLAPIWDEALVLPTVVQAFGLQSSHQPPFEHLRRRCKSSTCCCSWTTLSRWWRQHHSCLICSLPVLASRSW
jgi:hypothetical protein